MNFVCSLVGREGKKACLSFDLFNQYSLLVQSKVILIISSAKEQALAEEAKARYDKAIFKVVDLVMN
jgi:hypothetical protein